VSVAKRIIVSGRVQGVFFRDTCRREANRLGVSGSAANLPDGTVEVVAEGDEDAVESLIAWCRSGPDYASVDSVDVTDVKPTGASSFKIS
jgi:acylphosphatase